MLPLFRGIDFHYNVVRDWIYISNNDTEPTDVFFFLFTFIPHHFLFGSHTTPQPPKSRDDESFTLVFVCL